MGTSSIQLLARTDVGARVGRDATPLPGEAPSALENALGSSKVLEVRDLGIEFVHRARRVPVLNDVSFDVYNAERLVLLGPSGCGKSTLLKAIGGFVKPVRGEISLDGQTVNGPGIDRMFVFQEFDQLAPWKTVLQNVMFPLRIARGLSRQEARERAHETLAKVGLSRFADAYPHTLSGGMKQRVAIARALAVRPRVLLMDEPFAALDALTRLRMQEELLRLWDDTHVTLLFVTHSIEEALIVGSRIVLLDGQPGRLRAELDAGDFEPGDAASPEFRHATARIHHLLFGEHETA
ncbi:MULTISPECIES: ABC transporter ATP-binding protein [Pandoraea]|uniref:ABC transporter ATP-binding protein n=1 Tax=Pandoraea TaxID=93217 RepID=UPI001F5C417A|nr:MULTISPECIES: ABC transporter ATP-binding protein [Pandoraea]MCI3206482.1 sulfonate ABC transporter ATP-binding protein [Pandoraea sp. LA3]MDN4584510.1 sulfonate ABC transporter ATP-binding protein [Pandoraea capi]